ncbi:hypothetical protein CKAH01_18115 [Colletotrichum kahawae]|uniref:Uncharacterized protein n=1 Tax=Colletotrichum kahawae TaxID=34407 RepID=A0AAD9Y7Z1_COLKA|nr:hypothetical protein CKAH01_18115 [Colletotrichum kahawae]
MRIIHLLACLVALGLADVRKCNGHEHLCNRKYSNVTFVGSHNAIFVGDGLSHNQNVPVTRQLDMGVRFLTIQRHWENDEIRMCHSKCWLLDVGMLEDFLLELSGWMKNHPNEVGWIIDWFSYSWETPYGELDNNFPHCKRDRPRQHIDESKYMYLINHVWNKAVDGTFEGDSIKITTRHATNITNSMDSINRQVNLCKAKWERYPTSFW